MIIDRPLEDSSSYSICISWNRPSFHNRFIALGKSTGDILCPSLIPAVNKIVFSEVIIFPLTLTLLIIIF